jgi:hypothetical protein
MPYALLADLVLSLRDIYPVSRIWRRTRLLGSLAWLGFTSPLRCGAFSLNFRVNCEANGCCWPVAAIEFE